MQTVKAGHILPGDGLGLESDGMLLRVLVELSSASELLTTYRLP